MKFLLRPENLAESMLREIPRFWPEALLSQPDLS
jgi:hypothetical protein